MKRSFFRMILMLCGVLLPTIAHAGSFGVGSVGKGSSLYPNTASAYRGPDLRLQAADQEAIAAYYDQEAADAKKKADLHRNTADTYQKLNIAKPVGMLNMCTSLVKYWDQVAEQARDLARAHRAMAKAAGEVG